MKRSSIFSFSTLSGVPRIPAPAWLALGLFAAVRLVLLCSSDAFLPIPESELQQLYVTNELRYRAEDSPHPRIIVAGTSRLGILPADGIARSVGCEPDDVANYALSGNTFWRTLVFFRRNPGILRDADVVVFDLLPFQLHQSELTAGADELVLRMATLDERLRLPAWKDRGAALADVVIPLWSERHSAAGWFSGFRLLDADAQQRFDGFVQLAHEARAYREELRTERPRSIDLDAAMEYYAPASAMSPLEVHAVQDLIDVIPDTCTLLFVWLPVYPPFAGRLEQTPPEQSCYEAFKSFMLEVEHPRVKVLWASNAEVSAANPEAAFTEDDFTDIVHYTDSGIGKVCGLLVSAIQERGSSR